MRDDPGLEAGKLGRRIQSELVAQMRAVGLIRPQCFCLTSRPIQRDHQLRAEAVAQRIALDQVLQLADRVDV